jgi:hypothetical protein
MRRFTVPSQTPQLPSQGLAEPSRGRTHPFVPAPGRVHGPGIAEVVRLGLGKTRPAPPRATDRTTARASSPTSCFSAAPSWAEVRALRIASSSISRSRAASPVTVLAAPASPNIRDRRPGQALSDEIPHASALLCQVQRPPHRSRYKNVTPGFAVRSRRARQQQRRSRPGATGGPRPEPVGRSFPNYQRGDLVRQVVVLLPGRQYLRTPPDEHGREDGRHRNRQAGITLAMVPSFTPSEVARTQTPADQMPCAPDVHGHDKRHPPCGSRARPHRSLPT